ncbi:hypothetical protein CsSME_00016758 [Camellia sinensis var. sinensis]
MFLAYEYMERGSLFCSLRSNADAVELGWTLRLWGGGTGNNHGKASGRTTLVNGITSTRNRMLADVLDPRLPLPTNPMVVGNIVLVARMAIACLCSEPRFRPTMLCISQEFQSCRKTFATPLCAISLLQLWNAEIDFYPTNE